MHTRRWATRPTPGIVCLVDVEQACVHRVSFLPLGVGYVPVLTQMVIPVS